jgi:hypothetical protein
MWASGMAATDATRSLDTLRTSCTRLIGQDAELVDTVRALLLKETGPLMTLTGAGGVGKTRPTPDGDRAELLE